MLPLRPLLPSSRILLQLNPPSRYLSHSSKVHYVKLKRPWVRNLLTKCLFYGLALYTCGISDLWPRDDPSLHDADTRKSSPKEGTREYSKVDESKQSTHDSFRNRFIPLGWPRLQQSNLYASSDPEWQAFVKISKDNERKRALQDELLSIVRSEVSRADPVKRIIGPLVPSSDYWLMFRYPNRPPPAYYRSGLEITEAGVSWVSKPMSQEGGDTLRRSMRPLFMALAVKDASLVFWKSFIEKFKASNSDDPRALSLSDSLPTLMSSDFTTLDKLGDTSPSEPQLLKSTNSQSSTSKNDETSHLHPSIILSTLQRLPLPEFGPESDLNAARLAFKRRLIECWTHERRNPRRGTFFLAGPVGLKGSSGFCRIEVAGQYDPVTSKWVSISWFVRDINAHGGQVNKT
ncbi:hypothetical protein BDW59DRAFT_147514 [Aspergillus cavernicola]|uniref:Uncharacterized protein n=1 Tax=Aspergillus cavernicola TaxID=176166 RepID=A0ABR4I9W8_9EURO